MTTLLSVAVALLPYAAAYAAYQAIARSAAREYVVLQDAALRRMAAAEGLSDFSVQRRHEALCEDAARRFGRPVAYRWYAKTPKCLHAALLFEGGAAVEIVVDRHTAHVDVAADDAFPGWQVARAKAMTGPRLECVETMDIADPVAKTDTDATEAEWAFGEQGR